MKKMGIYAKTFFYTIFLILSVIVVTLAIFSEQAVEFYNVSKHQNVREIFTTFQEELEGKSYDEVRMTAERFHEDYPEYEFALYDYRGSLVFATPYCEGILDQNEEGWVLNQDKDPSVTLNLANFNPSDNNLGLLAFYPEFGPPYIDFIKMTAALLAAVLVISSIAAAMFAKIITDPIKRIARDACKMSSLEPVSPPPERHDEIGQLGKDVHEMYWRLKNTITDMKMEIDRRTRMEESQRYFFSAVSHELKTPIAAVNALLEGMLENIGDYQNHTKYVMECFKLTNTQTKLVNEILDIVKLTDGRVKPCYEEVNLNEAVHSLLDPYFTLAGRKSQKLMVDIPHNMYCIVDKKMFSRALCNILINSIQYSNDGENIEVWCDESEERVCLNILNTGAQIEEDVMERLFEPFYRIDSARSRKDGHSGLGLTIVNELLNKMEIPFELRNTEKGVLFSMKLLKAES